MPPASEQQIASAHSLFKMKDLSDAEVFRVQVQYGPGSICVHPAIFEAARTELASRRASSPAKEFPNTPHR